VGRRTAAAIPVLQFDKAISHMPASLDQGLVVLLCGRYQGTAVEIGDINYFK